MVLRQISLLRCEERDEAGAKFAVRNNRPCAATCYFTDDQWDNFSAFFREFPSTTFLHSSENSPRRFWSRATSDHLDGGAKKDHEALMISADHDCLAFVNSWGTDRGDNGCF